MSKTKQKDADDKEFQIHCEFTEMRDVVNLQSHPQNPNKHPDRQVALLAKILRHQGWRAPIQVSKRSGFVVAGHGRLEAAKLGGLQSVPVDVQDFENEADELAHLLADNRIAELSDLDMNEVKEMMESDAFADLDLDLTGYDELSMGMFSSDVNDAEKEWEGMPEMDCGDVLGVKSLIVNFPGWDEYRDFAKLIGQDLSENTKSIHFPPVDVNGPSVNLMVEQGSES